ncbi:MAG: NAD-dependent succinate-semialdehyde dehydrogenase [Cyanobacteria bacterium J06559_1]
MGIASINPATGQTLKTYAALEPKDIESALALGQRCFETYRNTDFPQRSQWMHKAADTLEAQKEALGKTMTLEMGKTIGSAIAEVEKCAWVCRYYADHTETFLQDEPASTDASSSYVRFLPLGIVLAVMPWNYPLWQVFRAAAPALMAGNTMLLKHASNVPQCALAIADIFTTAGFPDGAFQTLLIGASQVAPVLADPRVKSVSLTGSGPAGAAVAATAAKHIKKSVLELGGSDPFIVLPSADVESAIATATTARLMNNGQSCIAAKRFILVGDVADAFEQGFADRFKAQKVGDPMDEDTTVGPLATPDILKELDAQVKACVQQGATVLVGADPQALQKQISAGQGAALKNGNFYPPTILTHIPPDAPTAQEEFFGPVALVFRVETLDEAIALANSTDFGLGASAWTTDKQEQQQLINTLEAGAVFINGLVKSDPRLPFGGIKTSGYGRELGRYGLLEFVNAKTVWVK